MPLELVCNDITKIKVDAIVNAANKVLKIGDGVCGAIFHAAGAGELQEAFDQIGGCKGREAVTNSALFVKRTVTLYKSGSKWKVNKFNAVQ
ncbi:macro domain-containing protein [Bacillus sp. JJ634]